MTNNSNHFTHDAWEANAEVWDARMGDEGNDFFKTKYEPNNWRYRRLGRKRLGNGKLPKFRPTSKKRAESQPSGARFVGQAFSLDSTCRYVVFFPIGLSDHLSLQVANNHFSYCQVLYF